MARLRSCRLVRNTGLRGIRQTIRTAMNYDKGLLQLSNLMQVAGYGPDSDEYLGLLRLQRQLSESIDRERRFAVFSPQEQEIRERILTELDRLAVRFSGGKSLLQLSNAPLAALQAPQHGWPRDRSPNAGPSAGDRYTVRRDDLPQLIAILADYHLFQTPDSRQALLALTGLAPIITVNLNGSAKQVASTVVVQLNDYGLTNEGDSALTRLFNHLVADPALPPSASTQLVTILSG